MAGQSEKGKMLEYAVLNRLEDVLTGEAQVIVEESKALHTAKSFYQNGDIGIVKKMDCAAKAAVRALIKLEPRLKGNGRENVLHLSIQEDLKGIGGDVRDVLCIRRDLDWEIGISCKHNHAAVKHSRLSNTIDFGEKWMGYSCSETYFQKIRPIFDELENLGEQEILFSQLNDKAERFYMPILEAFSEEIKKLERENGVDIPRSLLRYLLGKQDFYKVITKDVKKITKVEAYNLNGTLNLPNEKIKAETSTPLLKLPEKIYDISYKPRSNNTIIITFDKGWAVSFRIHNAEKKVQNSLKFDINLIGVPRELHTQIEAW